MKPEQHSMIKLYVIGFIASLVLTLSAYYITVSLHGPLSGQTVSVLVGIAVTQIIVQLICFLHIGREEAPRWNLISFITMVMVVLFIVIGSIWVMNNLNYNMMNDHVESDIMRDEGMH